MPSIRKKYRTRIVEFRHFWLSIEHFIGNAYLPLFAQAQDLSEFIADIDSQSNPLHAVLQESYRRAKCTTLNSSIDPFLVMDILGESLFDQKNRADVDVTLIDLIERIGLHISRQFIDDNENQEKVNRQQALKDSSQDSLEKSSRQQNNNSNSETAVIINFNPINKS